MLIVANKLTRTQHTNTGYQRLMLESWHAS